MMSSELPVSDSSSRLPRRLGRYALFEFIGKGGMAEIFLARASTELGATRLCVLKQIISQFAEHPQFAEMLTHEAKLAARLNHAHIVQVFDLGRADGQLFIAMEYVEGFDLNALLRRCSARKVALPIEFALGIVCDVLKALDYAHRRMDDSGRPLEIVHRDVSPSNVLISFEGEVKLCDFGIAHANDAVIGRESSVTAVEAIKGKAGYMSPEHARGESIDARADIFAAGVVLWELVSGRRMYRLDDSKLSLLEQARLARVPPMPIRGLPREEQLHSIMSRALSVAREDRYSSASAMLRELQGYMADARLLVSPLKVGEWMNEKFEEEILEQRQMREKLVQLLGEESPISPLPISPNHSSFPPPTLSGTQRVARTATSSLAVPRGSTSVTPLPPPSPSSSSRLPTPQAIELRPGLSAFADDDSKDGDEPVNEESAIHAKKESSPLSTTLTSTSASAVSAPAISAPSSSSSSPLTRANRKSRALPIAAAIVVIVMAVTLVGYFAQN